MPAENAPQTYLPEELPQLGELLLADFEAKHQQREKALAFSRAVIRQCAESIRATHRLEYAEAERLLVEAEKTALALQAAGATHADIQTSGYTQDALKEWVEARLVLRIVRGEPIPPPQILGVGSAVFLHGLSEAATELRRRILDILRSGYNNEVERLLQAMDEIYSLLVTIDYPDAITYNLRRQTDILRSVLERTRGDVTTSFRQFQLERALEQTFNAFPHLANNSQEKPQP